LESYDLALEAQARGSFLREIVQVNLPKLGLIKEDEEPKKLKREKVSELKAVFAGKDGKGTVTAANASKLNDGASMILMMNSEGIKATSLDPGFEIIAYADAEVEPSDFNIAPNTAILKALA
jgi:acetyl-CoA C-acetyltransferase